MRESPLSAEGLTRQPKQTTDTETKGLQGTSSCLPVTEQWPPGTQGLWLVFTELVELVLVL